MKGLSGMTPISVSARCCLSIDTLLELCYNNRVIRRYVMKRSLSWLELLWYLPLYIISVYYHLNSVMVLVIVAVGYTVSHYHKYTSSAEYREHYKKSFLFVHTKDTYATLQISCIWGILFSLVCCVYFFLHDTSAGFYSLIPAVLPLILLLYIRKANKKTH